MKLDTFQIIKIEEHHIDEIYNLLSDTTFDENEYISYFKATNQLKIWLSMAIKQKYSYKIVDNHDEIVAVAINLDYTRLTISSSITLSCYDDAATETAPNTIAAAVTSAVKTPEEQNGNDCLMINTIILQIFHKLEETRGLLDLHVYMLNEKWQKRGLARYFCHFLQKLAFDEQFPGAAILATNLQQIQLAESLGYKRRFRLKLPNRLMTMVNGNYLENSHYGDSGEDFNEICVYIAIFEVGNLEVNI